MYVGTEQNLRDDDAETGRALSKKQDYQSSSETDSSNTDSESEKATDDDVEMYAQSSDQDDNHRNKKLSNIQAISSINQMNATDHMKPVGRRTIVFLN